MPEDVHSFVPSVAELCLPHSGCSFCDGTSSVPAVALANTDPVTTNVAARCCKGFSCWTSHFFSPRLEKAQLPYSSNGNFWRKLYPYFIFNVPQSDFSPEYDLAVTARSSPPDELLVWARGPGESLPPAIIYLSLKCNKHRLRQPPLCITHEDWSNFKAEMTVMLRSDLQSR